MMKKVMKMQLLFLLSINLMSGCSIHSNESQGLPPKVYSSSHDSIATKTDVLKLQSIEIRKAFIEYEKTGHAPVITRKHSLIIPFGQETPVIDCTPLRTSDITLEIGEVITGVYAGDTARWLFEQAVSGDGNQRQMHVIIKPKAYNIDTNAIITTNRRTYDIELKSLQETAIKQVSFYYPEDIKNQLILFQKEEKQEVQQNNLSWNSQSFDYHYLIETGVLEAKPKWMPLRAFNDGAHVYIQMPPEADTMSLPTLLIDSHGRMTLTNYRVRKPYYIVDELFDKAVLVSGVDKDEKRVTITYNKGDIL